MSKVKDYLNNTAKKINKPTLTTVQVYKALSKKVTRKELQENKVKTDNTFLLYQTLMGVGLKLAINKAEQIFNGTLYSDRAVISNIRLTLIKLLKSFTSKLKTNVESYDMYLEESAVFLERLCTLGFGVKKENRDMVLLYIAKIGSWLNSEHNGQKDNFIWVDYGETVKKEFNVYGEVLEVEHIDKPNHGDRDLLYTYPGMKGYLVSVENNQRYYEEVVIEQEGVLSYYDDQTKQFILDDGIIIKATNNLKWISYEILTKSLNGN